MFNPAFQFCLTFDSCVAVNGFSDSHEAGVRVFERLKRLRDAEAEHEIIERLQVELGKLKTENDKLRADRQHFYDYASELEKKVAQLEECNRLWDKLATRVMGERDAAQAELKEVNKQLGDSQLDRINARKAAQQQADISTCLKQCCDDRDEEIASLKAKLEQENSIAIHRLNIGERQRQEINALKAKLEQAEKGSPLVEVVSDHVVTHCCHSASGPEVRIECRGPADIKVTGHAKYDVRRPAPIPFY